MFTFSVFFKKIRIIKFCFRLFFLLVLMFHSILLHEVFDIELSYVENKAFNSIKNNLILILAINK